MPLPRPAAAEPEPFALDRSAPTMHRVAMRHERSVNAVTLGTLVRICSIVHGVPTDRIPALKGRFRNLLKMGFPDVKGAGTGRRAEYWPDHVALVLVAFELMRFRMPQTIAVIAVNRHRSTVLDAMGRAARRAVGGDETASVWLSVSSNAFLDDAKQPDLSDVAISGIERVREAGDPDGATSFIVDPSELLSQVVIAAALTDEPFGADFFVGLGADGKQVTDVSSDSRPPGRNPRTRAG